MRSAASRRAHHRPMETPRTRPTESVVGDALCARRLHDALTPPDCVRFVRTRCVVNGSLRPATKRTFAWGVGALTGGARCRHEGRGLLELVTQPSGPTSSDHRGHAARGCSCARDRRRARGPARALGVAPPEGSGPRVTGNGRRGSGRTLAIRGQSRRLVRPRARAARRSTVGEAESLARLGKPVGPQPMSA